jgi:type II secretory pathway component PulK
MDTAGFALSEKTAAGSDGSEDMNKQRKNGTILVTALWIIAILTIFAVSVGRQSAVNLKLTSYSIDRLKAYFIARAGISRAIAEKRLEYNNPNITQIDALGRKWASNPELFDHHKFGDGTYTVGYKLLEKKSEDKENPNPILYGLMDEESKININYAPKETLANLIESFEVERPEAEEIAAAIVDWRDQDSDITTEEKTNFNGAEDSYYQGLEEPYHCKNMPFNDIYEIIFIRAVQPKIFTDIKPYITVYGEGKVNLNTATERALDSIFGAQFPNLASKIVRYRQGNDGVIGTRDDRWFCLGEYKVERKEEGLVEIKNLQEAEWYANIYGITTEEYNRIKDLAAGKEQQLEVSSKTYRAIATGEVKKVKVRVEAVYMFGKKGEQPVIKFWYQE